MTMKRFMALTLAVLLLLTALPDMLPAAQAEPSRAGCTSGQSADGMHYWTSRRRSASCETAGGILWICRYCKKEVFEQTAPALGHEWSDWTQIEQPTCTDTGLRTRSCHRCQKQETLAVAALGHSFTRPWTTIQAPTCTEAGRGMNTCVRCGYEWWREIEATGHDWDEGVVTKEPTMTGEGERTYTCKNDPNHTKTEPIPAKAGLRRPMDGQQILRLYAYPSELPQSMTAGNTIRFKAYMRNDSDLSMIDGFIAMDAGSGYFSESYVTPDRNDPTTEYAEFEHEITQADVEAGLLTVTFIGRNMPNGDEYSEIDAGPVVLTYATGRNDAPMISVMAEDWPTGSYAAGMTVRIPVVLKVLSDKPVTLERFVYQSGDAVMCGDEMEAHLGLKPGQEYRFTYLAEVSRKDVLTHTGDRTLGISVSDEGGILYNATCVLGFSVTKKERTEHTHEFGRWKMIAPLTRKEDGMRERRCLICGFAETELLEAAPKIIDGQRDQRVVQLQYILDDLGYRPARITGVADRDFWGIVENWSRDHGWYYVPGLLRPIVIDEIVHDWIDLDDWVRVSGEDTAVNIVFTVTPDRDYDFVRDGEKLSFTWEAVNLGKEDCRLGPVLVSYGKNNTSKDVQKIYQFVADLDGNTLRAGGANTLTGTFSIVADFGKTQERTGYDADHYTGTKYGKLYLNARALGTSLETNRKWYSNTFTKKYTVSDDTVAISPDLKVYGGAVNEKEFYCANDMLEYIAGLTYTGEKELHDVLLEAVIVGDGGQSAMYTRYFDTLAPGTDFSKQNYYTLGADFTQMPKIEFWIEASGYTPEGDLICAERYFFAVNGHPQYDPLILSLTGSPKEMDKTYTCEDRVYYWIALNNLSDEPLGDYTIRVSLGDGLEYPMADEFSGASVDANGNTRTYTGALPVLPLGYSSLGASLLATATAYTKDGRLVEAQPLEWWLDVEDPDSYPPISHLILKVVQTSPAKAQYRIGDEISFWCEMIMDGDVMPEYMAVTVCESSEDSVDFVCETGDGGASSPGGVSFGDQAFAASVGGSCTVTLAAEDVTDGCVNLLFEGACAMKSGEGFSHNSNRVTFTFPIS